MACVDPVEFCSARLGFTPDVKQTEGLLSKAKRAIWNMARQSGKSTVAAAMAVFRAWSQPGQLILFCSPSERQSAELLRKAETFVRKLGIAPKGDGDNQHSIQFPNGSRIVALPGTDGTVRGFSAVNLLVIDEASRVDDALYKALRPLLLVGDGDLWLMSTPYGKRGFFWETWDRGGKQWHRIESPATENPRVRAEQLEEERELMGAAYFEQEYLCRFVDNGTQVFRMELIEQALSTLR